MKDARYPRRALLILSDGGDNHSRYTDHDVKNAVREADILIYAVGTYDRYVNTQEELLGPELLQSVAGVTGRQAYTLMNLAELPQVTRAIGTRLRHQYMLTYRPQTHSRDGKWHKINVKLLLPKKIVLIPARERPRGILLQRTVVPTRPGARFPWRMPANRPQYIPPRLPPEWNSAPTPLHVPQLPARLGHRAHHLCARPAAIPSTRS